MGLLITGARLDGRIVSIRLGKDIVEVGPALQAAGEEVLDAGGATVIPGLHDHHVHLLAMAAARESLQCGPPEVTSRSEMRAALTGADAALPPGDWIRGVGYHESVAGDLDRQGLDELVSTRPVRIQHRSGVLWMLNTEALERVGGDTTADGRLWRQDDWLRARVPERRFDFTAIGNDAIAQGITGFTDATPHGDVEQVQMLTSGLPQHVHWMASPEAHHDGPAKVLLDDDRLPALDDLVDRLRPARRAGRALAFHSVTHVQAALAIAAWNELGGREGDRVEHGALLSPDQAVQLGRLGVTVVTQPALVASRGDRYLADVVPEDQPDLWRLASLLRAGVAVAAGSDAPYGPADPWAAVEAAVTRRTTGGLPLGAGEAVSREEAVALFFGEAAYPARLRSVRAGQPGDLCLVGTGGVEGTVIAGKVVHLS